MKIVLHTTTWNERQAKKLIATSWWLSNVNFFFFTFTEVLLFRVFVTFSFYFACSSLRMTTNCKFMIGNINDKVNEKKRRGWLGLCMRYVRYWEMHVRLFGESRKVVENHAIISHAIYFVLVNGNSRLLKLF